MQLRRILVVLRTTSLLTLTWLLAIPSYAITDDEVLETMQIELDRSMEAFSQEDPPVHYLSYEITEAERKTIGADRGKLQFSSTNRNTTLDLDLRVGDPQFDNTHVLPTVPQRGNPRGISFQISIGDPLAMRQSLWYVTDLAYKSQSPVYVNLKNAAKLQQSDSDSLPDFAVSAPNSLVERDLKLDWKEKAYQKILEEVSDVFRGEPNSIYGGQISLTGGKTNTFFVNSEGSSIKQATTMYTLSMQTNGQNENGETMSRNIQFSSHTLSGLPNKKELLTHARSLKQELLALLKAPLVDPYTGPAILSGRATGVFFHEILGHRLEGHRLRLASDAQTFKEKINQQVLPKSFNVYFDPTIDQLDGIDLMGAYRYDNQGVKSRKVSVIENGILKGFLMSRSPLEEFPHSNGHGRKQTGFKPVSRQSNLIVDSTERVPLSELKQMLLDEAKKQGKDFGLLFEDIDGGFTFTGRSMPNAFNVNPTVVYKIHLDGREELVRGADLIGTPLTAFSRIVAASEENGVFNGWCGAESGSVPVSAVAPAILVVQVEVQKKPSSEGRLPILPAPLSATGF